MGKKSKLAKLDWDETVKDEEQGKHSIATMFSVQDDDDDDEANEDLSLKIVQKAMLRSCNTPETADGVVSIVDNSSPPSAVSRETEIVTSVKYKNKKKTEKKIIFGDGNAVTSEFSSSFKEFCSDISQEQKEMNVEVERATDIMKLPEAGPDGIVDNVVLRKLLRGPRYFDPPGGGCVACYNCGEDGHTAFNCTSAKRKRPCHFCGSLNHHFKQCNKARDCLICKKSGHLTKDCPEKYEGTSKSFKICLKCGDPGHDMFSCINNYLPEDLKEIQCYVCKSFGHLCCVDYPVTGPRTVSCYRCGKSGHTGLTCGKSHGEPYGAVSHFLCHKCGEGGHFARKCKVVVRNGELSTPKKRRGQIERDALKAKSAPSSIEKKRKKNWHQESRYTSSPKIGKRGGWITDDPGDILPNGRASPSTPKIVSNWIPRWNGGSAAFRYPPSTPTSNRIPMWNGGSDAYSRRHSASRFGNFSSGGIRRNDYR